MTEFYVKLQALDDIREFVSAASLTPVDIDVVSGRYTIDAKSVLGLFSLNLEEPVLVRVYGSEAEGETFRKAVARLAQEPRLEP